MKTRTPQSVLIYFWPFPGSFLAQCVNKSGFQLHSGHSLCSGIVPLILILLVQFLFLLNCTEKHPYCWCHLETNSFYAKLAITECCQSFQSSSCMLCSMQRSKEKKKIIILLNSEPYLVSLFPCHSDFA